MVYNLVQVGGQPANTDGQRKSRFTLVPAWEFEVHDFFMDFRVDIVALQAPHVSAGRLPSALPLQLIQVKNLSI